MTIRPRMSSILDLIGEEQPELFALELKKNCYIGLCLLSSIYNFEPISTKLCQNIYITTRSWMGLIMGLIGLERLELFAR